MNRIFIPVNKPEDWQVLLADPEKQWKSGYSASALAYCWQEANDFPMCVQKVFSDSELPLFKNIELLIAFPEYKVPLPGGSRSSQNDVFVLAKGQDQLVSIMVEGKVEEPFGPTISEWKSDFTTGKRKRLEYLIQKINMQKRKIDHLRYQLLHRTASAIIEAERFCSRNAMVLVHSFSESNQWIDDYKEFLSIYNLKGEIGTISGPVDVSGINLYFAWVEGDKRHLNK